MRWLIANFISFLIFFSLNVKISDAQTVMASKFTFSAGLETGAITGYERTYQNIEGGITARLQYGLSNRLAITLTTGYYNFFGKNVNYAASGPGPSPAYTLKTSDFQIVPVKAGIKGFLLPHIYLSAEAGIGFESSDGVNYNSNEAGQRKLILSPGMGYATNRWEAGLRYESLSGKNRADLQYLNYGIIGLHAALNLGR